MGDAFKPGNICVIAFALLVANPVFAEESDAYLDALTEEADRLANKPQEQAPEPDVVANAAQPGPARPGHFADGLSFEQFTADLQSQFSGTYTFFSRLSNNAQHEVYKDYQGNSEIKFVREKVMQRFLNK